MKAWVFVLLLSASVSAGGKPLPASQHKPPVILDESKVTVALAIGDKGYHLVARIEMTGLTSKTDRVRVDVKQGGKLLATAPCDHLSVTDQKANGTCENTDSVIAATGPIDAELIYVDDQADKEYLVRTFKLNVHEFVRPGTKEKSWQIMADDVLAAAWVRLDDDTFRKPQLAIWFATDAQLRDAVLRCTAGDKKIPDIAVTGSGGYKIRGEQIAKNGDLTAYLWTQALLSLDVIFGKREANSDRPPDTVLGDNPGKWDCNLRRDGKVIRELLFTVTSEGMIATDEIQSGKNAIPTVSDRVVLIENHIGKDAATFDKRIVPDAMKKSMAFGLPWPEHAKVKTIHASYPAKSGLPDPK